MLAYQPARPVEFTALLVGCERQNQVAARLVTLPVQAQKGGHKGSVGVLHILRAAAVVVAILFDKLKGIGVPVGAERLHHVHVTEKEDRLLRGLTGGTQADDEVLFARIWPQQMHVLRRKSCVKEPLPHRRGGRGHVAPGRVRGIDLDELLEDLPRQGAILR